MTISLKIISLLLSYPSADLQSEMPALKAALKGDNLIGARERTLIGNLGDDIAKRDLYDAQERYVLLFDRSRSLSMHLFEHVHGESRDRGQAMVDLRDLYDREGFEIAVREMPDYLPLFLEFLSTRPTDEARALLGETAHILTALKERLRKRHSIYANAFVVLEAIAKGKPDRELVRALLAEPEDDPEDLAALDRVWEEEVVTFGGNAGESDCGPDRIRRQVRATQRRPRDVAPSTPS